ncbi:hypothetical protein COBT_003158, partial [Conglomerata obtusa]
MMFIAAITYYVKFKVMVICANIYLDHEMISYCGINSLFENNSSINLPSATSVVNSEARLIDLCDSIDLFNEGNELFPDFEIPENLNSSNTDTDDKKSDMCKNTSLYQITNFTNDFKNTQHNFSDYYNYDFDFKQQININDIKNDQKSNAITNFIPSNISILDNNSFLTQKTRYNNQDRSPLLHGKIHNHSEISNSYTNNLSSTISNYNIQKNNMNLSINEHKGNSSNTIVFYDEDASALLSIDTSKHSACFDQNTSVTNTLIDSDCKMLDKMSNNENDYIENLASIIENNKNENLDYNIQKNHNNEENLPYDICEQSNIVENVNANSYNTNMFSNPICKMSDQIHQKKEIMKPNDEVSIQNLHKDDYVDITNEKRSITKHNNILLTIKKKHITKPIKKIKANITDQNNSLLKSITMNRVSSANNLIKNAKQLNQNELILICEKMLEKSIEMPEIISMINLLASRHNKNANKIIQILQNCDQNFENVTNGEFLIKADFIDYHKFKYAIQAYNENNKKEEINNEFLKALCLGVYFLLTEAYAANTYIEHIKLIDTTNKYFNFVDCAKYDEVQYFETYSKNFVECKYNHIVIENLLRKISCSEETYQKLMLILPYYEKALTEIYLLIEKSCVNFSIFLKKLLEPNFSDKLTVSIDVSLLSDYFVNV